MDTEEMLIVMGSIVLVFIPALALTARFALKPIVEAIIRLREGFTSTPREVASDQRLLRMEQQLSALQRRLDEVEKAGTFERQLGRGNDQ
jgi:hypothetical protein